MHGVREHVLRQVKGVEGADAGRGCGSLLCSMLVSSCELAVQTLVGRALWMMLEVLLPDGADPMVRGSPSRLYLAESAFMRRVSR